MRDFVQCTQILSSYSPPKQEAWDFLSSKKLRLIYIQETLNHLALFHNQHPWQLLQGHLWAKATNLFYTRFTYLYFVIILRM